MAIDTMNNDLRLNKNNKSHIYQILDGIVEFSPKDLRVTVKAWRDKRSVSQNALLWMWLTEIATSINSIIGDSYSKEDLHEYYKALFCPAKKKIILGKQVTIKSTKLLDRGEMYHYLSLIEQDAIAKGIKLTEPMGSEYHAIKWGQNGYQS